MHESPVKWLISTCLCLALSSCSNRTITKSDVDNYIFRNNNVSFGELKNIFVAQRSASFSSIIYVIDRFEGNQPVYFATYNTITDSVSDIHTVNSEEPNPGGYISKEEIENALRIVRSKKLYLLGVDSFQNVYVNPFSANQPPYLMRLRIATGDRIVRKGYVYELYKGNWYLNTHR